MLRNDDPPEGAEKPPDIKFHPVHGSNVQLKCGSRRAVRATMEKDGMVFSDRPIESRERVCIRQAAVTFPAVGSFKFGFTIIDPSSLREVHLFGKSAGSDMIKRTGTWARPLPVQLKEGDCLLFFVSTKGEIHFAINGVAKGSFLTALNTLRPHWAFFVLDGTSRTIEFARPPAPPPPAVSMLSSVEMSNKQAKQLKYAAAVAEKKSTKKQQPTVTVAWSPPKTVSSRERSEKEQWTRMMAEEMREYDRNEREELRSADEAAEKMEVLEGEVSSLQMQLEIEREVAEEAEDEVKQAARDAKDARSAAHKAREAFLATEKKLRTAEASAKSLENKLLASQSALRKAENRRDELSGQLTRCTKKLEQSDDARKEEKKRRRDLEIEATELRKLVWLQKEVNEKEQKIRKAQEEIAQLADAMAQERELFKQTQEKVDQLTTELNQERALTKKMRKAQDKVAQLSSEIAQERAIFENERKEMEESRKEREGKLKDQITALSDQLRVEKARESKESELQAQLRELKEKLAAANSQVKVAEQRRADALQKADGAADERVAELTAELEKERAHAEEDSKTIEESARALDEMIAESKKLTAEVARLKGQLEKARAVNEDARVHLKDSKSVLDGLLTESDKRKAEIADFEKNKLTEIARLQEDLDKARSEKSKLVEEFALERALFAGKKWEKDKLTAEIAQQRKQSERMKEMERDLQQLRASASVAEAEAAARLSLAVDKERAHWQEKMEAEMGRWEETESELRELRDRVHASDAEAEEAARLSLAVNKERAHWQEKMEAEMGRWEETESEIRELRDRVRASDADNARKRRHNARPQIHKLTALWERCREEAEEESKKRGKCEERIAALEKQLVSERKRAERAEWKVIQLNADIATERTLSEEIKQEKCKLTAELAQARALFETLKEEAVRNLQQARARESVADAAAAARLNHAVDKARAELDKERALWQEKMDEEQGRREEVERQLSELRDQATDADATATREALEKAESELEMERAFWSEKMDEEQGRREEVERQLSELRDRARDEAAAAASKLEMECEVWREKLREEQIKRKAVERRLDEQRRAHAEAADATATARLHEALAKVQSDLDKERREFQKLLSEEKYRMEEAESRLDEQRAQAAAATARLGEVRAALDRALVEGREYRDLMNEEKEQKEKMGRRLDDQGMQAEAMIERLNAALLAAEQRRANAERHAAAAERDKSGMREEIHRLLQTNEQWERERQQMLEEMKRISVAVRNQEAVRMQEQEKVEKSELISIERHDESARVREQKRSELLWLFFGEACAQLDASERRRREMRAEMEILLGATSSSMGFWRRRPTMTTERRDGVPSPLQLAVRCVRHLSGGDEFGSSWSAAIAQLSQDSDGELTAAAIMMLTQLYKFCCGSLSSLLRDASQALRNSTRLAKVISRALYDVIRVADCPYLFVTPNFLRSSPVLQRLKLSLYEQQGHFETFCERKEKCIRALDAVRSAQKLINSGSSATIQTTLANAELNLARALHKLLFQLMLMGELFGAVLRIVKESPAAVELSLSRSVLMLQHALQGAADKDRNNNNNNSDDNNNYMSGTFTPSDDLLLMMANEQHAAAIGALRQLRIHGEPSSNGSGADLGCCEQSDIDVLLLLFCRSHTTLRAWALAGGDESVLKEHSDRLRDTNAEFAEELTTAGASMVPSLIDSSIATASFARKTGSRFDS